MSPEDWLSAEMQGEIVALVHSHPGGLPWLSEADRRLQVQSDLPWWLVCRGAIHKFRCVPHLTGRRFEHGVTDCYTLFRDAYHLAGIEMPDFHRGDECGYHGPAVADEYDQPTSDITKDKCSKCLSGCKFRNNVGNFGGFLSINKLSQ
ncbi:putative tail fiber component K of prophage [Escherichia coli]|nr:putative tail fiber component K of prophage [Escherichia coli]